MCVQELQGPPPKIQLADEDPEADEEPPPLLPLDPATTQWLLVQRPSAPGQEMHMDRAQGLPDYQAQQDRAHGMPDLEGPPDYDAPPERYPTVLRLVSAAPPLEGVDAAWRPGAPAWCLPASSRSITAA